MMYALPFMWLNAMLCLCGKNPITMWDPSRLLGLRCHHHHHIRFALTGVKHPAGPSSKKKRKRVMWTYWQPIHSWWVLYSTSTHPRVCSSCHLFMLHPHITSMLNHSRCTAAPQSRGPLLSSFFTTFKHHYATDRTHRPPMQRQITKSTPNQAVHAPTSLGWWPIHAHSHYQRRFPQRIQRSLSRYIETSTI